MPQRKLSRLRVSAAFALAGGIITPTLETIRRWHQLFDLHYLINWLDDYIIGAFLIIAAIITFRFTENGRPWLIGAWGFATGMAFGSFIFQLQHLHEADPAAAGSAIVALVKGMMLLFCLIFLAVSIRFKS